MFFIHNRLFINNELNEIKKDKKFLNQWQNLLEIRCSWRP